MIETLNQIFLGVITIIGVVVMMVSVLIIRMQDHSRHKVEHEERHREKILDEHYTEWWPKWKIELEHSFSIIPRPFMQGPLNEKQILILYALAQAGTGGLQLRELMDLWGDQSIGGNQVKFRNDFNGLRHMVFCEESNLSSQDKHKRIIHLSEDHGDGAEYLINHKII